MNHKKRDVSVLIPYYKEKDEVFVFLQKRSKDAKRIPEYIGFFGGGLDDGETPEIGLKREIKEELGIDISDYKLFNTYEFYGARMSVFVMVVQKDFSKKVVVQEGEYGKFFTEDDVLTEEKILLQDKLILGNFFGLLKRDNPFIV